MSFSSETKAELCDSRLEKRSLALAECYGVLLYCNTFRTSEIRIITASALHKHLVANNVSSVNINRDIDK